LLVENTSDSPAQARSFRSRSSLLRWRSMAVVSQAQSWGPF
jgi:hypothetical protein